MREFHDEKGRFMKGHRMHLGTHHSLITKLKISSKRKGLAMREGNASWKGKDASYAAIHIWLVNNFGNPKHCENKKCEYPRRAVKGYVIKKPARFEWALLKGKKHTHKRSCYIRLCASCHRRYDNNIIKI